LRCTKKTAFASAKSLREMLFSKTQTEGLFCFENRKEIFEGVHRSFKFVVLTFQNGGQTKEFPAAFMRHDVADLIRFPQEGALNIKVDLVKRLSPGSLSVSALLSVEVYTKPAVKFGDFVGRLPRIQFARTRADCTPSFAERRKSFR